MVSVLTVITWDLPQVRHLDLNFELDPSSSAETRLQMYCMCLRGCHMYHAMEIKIPINSAVNISRTGQVSRIAGELDSAFSLPNREFSGKANDAKKRIDTPIEPLPSPWCNNVHVQRVIVAEIVSFKSRGIRVACIGRGEGRVIFHSCRLAALLIVAPRTRQRRKNVAIPLAARDSYRLDVFRRSNSPEGWGRTGRRVVKEQDEEKNCTSNFFRREPLEIWIRANRKSCGQDATRVIQHREQNEDVVHLRRAGVWVTFHCGVPLRNGTPTYPLLWSNVTGIYGNVNETRTTHLRRSRKFLGLLFRPCASLSVSSLGLGTRNTGCTVVDTSLAYSRIFTSLIREEDRSLLEGRGVLSRRIITLVYPSSLIISRHFDRMFKWAHWEDPCDPFLYEFSSIFRCFQEREDKL